MEKFDPRKSIELIQMLKEKGMDKEAFEIILEGTSFTDIDIYLEYLQDLIKQEN